jgi:hypothetical protein
MPLKLGISTAVVGDEPEKLVDDGDIFSPLPVRRERARVRVPFAPSVQNPHPNPLLFEPEPQNRRPDYRERG